jgi:signal transduction histidine kinase/DNA-binding response OmpR family regulator
LREKGTVNWNLCVQVKKNIQILMVEDSPADAVLMDYELRKAGLSFQSKRIETREEFLDEIKSNRPDVILLDHGLPTFDGFSALAMARECVPDVPVIFVTGSLGEETVVKTLKNGAHDYVLKHHMADLVPALHRALVHAHERACRRAAEEELQARVRQQEVAAELGLLALSTCDLARLTAESADRVAKTLGVEFCHVLELKAEAADWICRASVGWGDAASNNAVPSQDLWSLADYTLRMDQAVIFGDLRRETRFNGDALLRSHGIVSGMTALLRVKGRPAGLIGVYSSKARAFKQHDLHFLCGVANNLAAANERHEAEQRIFDLNADLERRVAQRTAQLELANSELEAFSYSVSHDLRAPLRHVDGFLQILRANLPDQMNDQADMAYRCISDAAKKMSGLIEDLLAFSRMSRTEMHFVPLQVEKMMDKIRHELRMDIESRKVQWQIHPLPEVHGDPEMMHLVITNLVANALKYTRPREEARIEIGSLAGEDETVIFVRDNGVGFDASYTHKLFGVFQRLHSTKEFDGTGIGLAIVRRIISRHGGRTWAEGKVDEGATFYFALPHRPSAVSLQSS